MKKVHPEGEEEGASWEGVSMLAANTTVEDELKDRVAFLNGKIEAQTQLYQNQISELRVDKEKSEAETKRLIAELSKIKVKNDDYEVQTNTLIDKALGELLSISKGKEMYLDEIQQLKNDLKVAHEKAVCDHATIQTMQAENDELRKKVQEYQEEKDRFKKELQATHSKEAFVWKSSGTKYAVRPKQEFTYCIDVLNSVALTAGIHIWSISVGNEAGVRMGIVSASKSHFARYPLGDTEGTWCYGGWGDLWHAGMPCGNAVPFTTGSTITFTLDLTDEGILYARVDGKVDIKLFSNLKSHADSFIPAVYLYKNSSICFLGFDKFADSSRIKGNERQEKIGQQEFFDFHSQVP